jgi:hypothetical protein
MKKFKQLALDVAAVIIFLTLIALIAILLLPIAS